MMIQEGQTGEILSGAALTDKMNEQTAVAGRNDLTVKGRPDPERGRRKVSERGDRSAQSTTRQRVDPVRLLGRQEQGS